MERSYAAGKGICYLIAGAVGRHVPARPSSDVSRRRPEGSGLHIRAQLNNHYTGSGETVLKDLSWKKDAAAEPPIGIAIGAIGTIQSSSIEKPKPEFIKWRQRSGPAHAGLARSVNSLMSEKPLPSVEELVHWTLAGLTMVEKRKGLICPIPTPRYGAHGLTPHSASTMLFIQAVLGTYILRFFSDLMRIFASLPSRDESNNIGGS
ncbi:uncharacterized protein ATNIH1004_001974 [Aspergillus tanneri]|uniref:Uncharacterized protein n=1 Tax=Aspergillus tanneri TaxID=1220188 RepID=A0A5M9M2V1_9EURO|nr:uncharacterized protein ATNIH1004_001974 [Aspergillus tanneri]KAA8641372.1 hypothetical protein ATNIH1004_001974 [Aspergillus tanneri]